MWLSIGGDDILGIYSACTHSPQGCDDAAAIAANISSNVAVMLDTLISLDPGLQFVMFGYDFVNFVQSAECVAMGEFAFGNFTTAQINGAFLAYVLVVAAVVVLVVLVEVVVVLEE